MSAKSPHHDAENPPKELKDRAEFEPRHLNIVWGEDNRYWKMPKDANEPAELLQVCWLEVSGSIPCAENGKRYKISFNISMKADAFGWNNCPVYVMAKLGKKGKYIWKKVSIQTDQAQNRSDIGDLEITAANNEPIYFGLYEVWSGKWKGGLLLHNATIQQV